MKSKLYKTLALNGLILFSTCLFAQAPPPPPGGGHGGTANQEGGGAPIGSGMGILLALSAGYGSRKVYDVLKEQESLEE
jgi:hypothetical protein